MDLEINELLDIAQLRLDQLTDALKTAKETIKALHNIGFNALSDERKEIVWQIYQQSPEMKKINAALTGV